MTVALYDDGERIHSNDYMLAAFDGNQCVGYTKGLELPLALDPNNTMVFPLMVYGNEDNVQLNFKAYEISTDTYYDINVPMQFTQDMHLGDALEPVSMDIKAGLPTVYNIGEPYPNPFNPVVNFDIDVSKDSHVSAKIYNIKGQVVATIHEGMLSARTHSMTWMASNHASGVYFVRVAINGTPATHKKIVLLK